MANLEPMTPKIIFLLSFGVISSCGLTNGRIETQEWKYSEGFHIGDWLDFSNTNLTIKNDTIYSSTKPVAVIVEKINSFVGADNQIKIASMETGEIGIYQGK